MLTTCLIVLIFGSSDFHHYWAKLCMRLQVCQLLRVLFLSYLVALITCVFLYLAIILSRHYYFPNSLCLVPAEILHNNTQARLNYVIKNLFDTVAGYPITLRHWYNLIFINTCTLTRKALKTPVQSNVSTFLVEVHHGHTMYQLQATAIV